MLLYVCHQFCLHYYVTIYDPISDTSFILRGDDYVISKKLSINAAEKTNIQVVLKID